MTNRLKLLLVEDNEGDAVLFGEYLESTKLAFELIHCETLADCLANIKESKFDIVFLDLGLPDSDGLVSLEAISREAGQLPVIILTGLNSEEIALRALRKGAQDFLPKGSITPESLVRSVNYAISRKYSENQLALSKSRIESLTETAIDAIFTLDENGHIIYCNPAAQLLLRTERSRLVGQSIYRYLATETQNTFRSFFNGFKGGNSEDCKGQSTGRIVDSNNFPVLDIEFTIGHWPTEQGYLFSLFVRDITQRRINEQEVKQALQVQKAIAFIQGLCGTNLHLSRKIKSALLTLLSIDWAGTENLTSAGVFLYQGDEISLKHTIGLEVCEEELKSVKRKFLEDKDLIFLDNAGTNYWFPLVGSDESNLGLFVIPFNLPFLTHTPNLKQLRVVLTTLTGMIEDHRSTSKIAQLNCAIEQSPVGVAMTDYEGNIHYVNQAVTTITGYAKEQIIGQNLRLFQSGLTPDSFYLHLWDTIRSGNVWKGELQNKRSDGIIYWESMTIAPVDGTEEDEVCFIALKENIDKRKQDEQQLTYMASHDTLTGLPNRVLLLDRLSQALAQTKRDKTGLAVLLLDLDKFSFVNDQHGHLVGDELLKLVAHRIKSTIRESDTVGRQGGDEFIVILPGVHGEAAVEQPIKAILSSLSKPFNLGDSKHKVSSSIGVVVDNCGVYTAGELYRRADIAMYQAKQTAGNSFCLFRNEMDDYLHSKVWFRNAIKDALKRNEFSIHYQPQVNNKSGIMIGAEALLRWNHPERGFISPGEFIPLAVQAGEIVSIGNWVLDEVCIQIKKWLDAGLHPPRIAINLSADQLLDKNLSETLAKNIKEYGLTPDLLELELTESEIMQSPKLAIQVLSKLQTMGIHIAGDDFGTGYSSLSYLKRLPLNRVKIDRTFISDITRDPESHAIASMIISLGHNLGLRVLAEGVEQKAQLNLLTRMGCDEFQGYYCSPAIPVDEFEELFSSKQKLIEVDDENTQRRNLLILDDESQILCSLYRVFRKDGYTILKTDDPEVASRYLAEYDVGVILCDQRMPEISGTEFLTKVKALYPNTVRMVLSGYTELNSIIDAINEGSIYKFLTKPWDDEQLRQHVEEAFQVYEMRKQNEENRQDLVS